MKVFISHSSYDKWVARQISKLLVSEGHTTFLDEKDIVTGESIDAAIQAHLKDSDHVLILLSPASIKSHWVFIELGGAKALEKKIVPFLFHVSANEIPQAISQLLARDINDFEKYIEELKVASKVPAIETGRPVKGNNKKGSEAAVASVAASEFEAELADLLRTSAKTLGHFNVGDTVRIVDVEHLTDDDKQKPPKWVKAMDKLSGVVTKITAFTPAGNALLLVDEDRYRWHPDWITKVTPTATEERSAA